METDTERVTETETERPRSRLLRGKAWSRNGLTNLYSHADPNQTTGSRIWIEHCTSSQTFIGTPIVYMTGSFLASVDLLVQNIPHNLNMAKNAEQINDTIPMAGANRTLFEFGEFDHSNIQLEAEEIPVIIIGSSMVGMFMGLLLGYHGSVTSGP